MNYLEWWNRNGIQSIALLCVGIIIFCLLFKPRAKALSGLANTIAFGRGRKTVKKKPTPKLKYESRCREILESIYKVEFPKKRPSFLKNPKTGRNLELDMFNEKLNLAVEYNGEQHYHFNKRFHGTVEKYEGQIYRDNFKRAKCAEKGIHLVEIPYTVPYDELETFIRSKIKGVDYKDYSKLANRTASDKK